MPKRAGWGRLPEELMESSFKNGHSTLDQLLQKRSSGCDRRTQPHSLKANCSIQTPANLAIRQLARWCPSLPRLSSSFAIDSSKSIPTM